MEAEDLEGMLPAFLSERLQQQASPKALARIEEVRAKKVRGEREENWNTFVVVAPRPFFSRKTIFEAKVPAAVAP